MTKRTSLFFIITVPFGTFPSISFISYYSVLPRYSLLQSTVSEVYHYLFTCSSEQEIFLKYFKRTVLVLNRLCHVESFSIIHLRYQKDRIRQRKPTLSEIFQLQTPICHLSFKEPWIYQSFRQHERRNAHKVSLAVA